MSTDMTTLENRTYRDFKGSEIRRKLLIKMSTGTTGGTGSWQNSRVH